jgi:hypothetical protein
MALNFRKFIEGLRIVPKAASTASEKGDLDVVSGSGKLNYHNGTTASPVVTEAHSASLTNKTIDADLNTLSNIEDGDIKVGANIARSKLASGTVNSVVLNNASGVLTDVTLSSAQIILGNASSIPTATTVSGEVTIDSLGVTTVGTVANAVTSGFLRTEMQSLAVSSTITTTKSFARLNSGSGTINGIAAGLNGQHLVLSNLTGASVIVQNQSGSATAVDRVVTGTGGAVSLENGASLFLIYNSTDARWYVVGGSGSGSSTINVVGAGVGVAAGKPVYLDSSGNAQLIDAGDDNKIDFIGVALDTSRIQVGGEITIAGASFTIGQAVFVNALTPGAYTQTAPSNAGQWVVPVGTASASDRMVINGAGGSTAVKITSEVDPYVYANVTAVSSNTTLTNGNSIVLATGGAGGITVTLPAPTAGKIFNIKKVDAGVGSITIDTLSGTIDGFSNYVLGVQYESLTVTTNGTNYFII